MLYKVALDPIMLYKLDNHSLNLRKFASDLLQNMAKSHSNRFKVKTNQFSYSASRLQEIHSLFLPTPLTQDYYFCFQG
jgi:hypothetical protein